MSSDAEYAAFLEKANQDSAPVEQQSSGGEKKTYGTKSVDTVVPKVLEGVEEYYVSDADELFEAVALKFDGKQVDAAALKKVLGGEREVEEVGIKGFETQYKKVVDTVKEAGSGEVKVFRVKIDATRSEYWVVTVDEKEKKIVGMKALSVES